MDRKEKILSQIDKEELGLEIGPSYNPIAPRSAGFNVRTLDYLDKEGLIDKYSKDSSVDTSQIEDVDYVWKGEPYSELIGNTNRFQWIIASHCIEHSTDLVTFLQQCSLLLTDTGVLSLAVPDKRFCFDHFRQLSSISQVVDTYHDPRLFHSCGNTLEFFLNAVRKGALGAWSPGESATGKYEFFHDLDFAKQRYVEVLEGEKFHDVHAWCFTPSSFRLMMEDLFSLGFIDLREMAFYDTAGCEFFVSLSRSGAGVSLDRLALLKRIEEELQNP